MGQQWKEIEGYEDRYEVSNDGNVRSLLYYSSRKQRFVFRKKPRLLKIETTHDGYKRVCLSYERNMKHHLVHRLVATAFIPNPKNYPSINHKDENPANNNVSNLEWCNHKYNSNYGTLRKRISERLSKFHHLSKKVIQMDSEGRYISEYRSAREAARQMGIRSECISRCCMGKSKTAAGYKWKYG